MEKSFAALARLAAETDPHIVDAIEEIDRGLLEWGLTLSPLERLRVCSEALQTLSGFRRVSSEASEPRGLD